MDLPLDGAGFAALMAGFGPFEPAPHLAVAVSGGADSLALAMLAEGWVRGRAGRLTALTVDHRLRPAAAAEAAQVAAWLGARGIAHHVLVWRAPHGRRGVQAAARAARYHLLEGWCAEAGVLHLLTAHHREDQAETLLLRLARGSGLDGLAGMAAVVERPACRLLRPLLTVSRARLMATLRACGQEAWIEDPSNSSPAYARSRLRGVMPALAAQGLSAERLAATAARLARSRGLIEDTVARLLARAVALDPAGFALLDAGVLAAAPPEIGLRALAAVAATISGADYPPRHERLERLYRWMAQGSGGGRTLGGCRWLPRRGGLLVCREPASLAPPLVAAPGASLSWDGRFRLTLPANAPPGLRLGALGGAAAPAIAADGRGALPAAVRATLPALSDDRGVVAVPQLGYVRSDVAEGTGLGVSLLFRPSRPLAGPGFTVV